MENETVEQQAPEVKKTDCTFECFCAGLPFVLVFEHCDVEKLQEKINAAILNHKEYRIDQHSVTVFEGERTVVVTLSPYEDDRGWISKLMDLFNHFTTKKAYQL
jgi:hypothetical protein